MNLSFSRTQLMRVVCCIISLSSILVLLSVDGYTTDLLSYVAQPDSSFRWSKLEETRSSQSSRIIFEMTSQTWQGIAWKHKIDTYIPASCDFPDIAILFVTGGSVGRESNKLALLIASLAKCPVAVLYNIPNQPLYGDLHEDALIAYTFGKAIETKDMTWPLLLPMTKSAVRAMDILQTYSKTNMKQEIKRFVVTGASKRGWTTWLTGAADPARVKGIMPMVYDNLNLTKQMDLQIDAYGTYSEQIADYTDMKLQAKLKTPEGRVLEKVVDPWAYKDRITMPKLIINGANDPYWNIASLNIYWKGLKGAKSVLYVPNAGHDLGMGDMDPQKLLKVVSPMSFFVQSIAKGEPMPKMTWKYSYKANECHLEIKTAVKDTAAKMWVATSDTRDFRKSKWNPLEMKAGKAGFAGSVQLPTKGYLAIFGEVAFSGSPAYSLNTQVGVFDTKGFVRM